LTAAGARHPDRRGQHLERPRSSRSTPRWLVEAPGGLPPAERRPGAGNERRRRIVHRRSPPVDREIVVDVKPAQK